MVNRPIEFLLTAGSHDAHRIAGWRGRLLPDKQVVDRDHRQVALAASIAFHIPVPETSDQPLSEECTSGAHGVGRFLWQ